MNNKYLTKIAYDYASRGTTPPPSPHVFNGKFKAAPAVKKGSKLKTAIGLGILGGVAYGGSKIVKTLSGGGQDPYGYQ